MTRRVRGKTDARLQYALGRRRGRRRLRGDAMRLYKHLFDISHTHHTTRRQARRRAKSLRTAPVVLAVGGGGRGTFSLDLWNTRTGLIPWTYPTPHTPPYPHAPSQARTAHVALQAGRQADHACCGLFCGTDKP